MPGRAHERQRGAAAPYCQEHEIGPGESVCIRRGQVHRFDNRGHDTAKFLAIASPGVFGPAYFQDMNRVLAATAGGPPDLAAVAEVMRRHGLTPANLPLGPS